MLQEILGIEKDCAENPMYVDREELDVELVLETLVGSPGISVGSGSGDGETPTAGRRGGGRLSVGVSSKRLFIPVVGSIALFGSGVGDIFWGSKGGGRRLSSV